MWVKICANTNLEDTQLAIDLGADAVGFVFAPSSRQVTPAQVGSIVERLRGGSRAERIGVFQSRSKDEIGSTVRAAGLTGVQLHHMPDAALISALRDDFGERLTIAQTLHWAVDAVAEETQRTLIGQAGELRRAGQVDRVLIDAKVGSAVGGTGQTFDWLQACAFFRQERELKMIVAGGLGPENVRVAVERLHPWGVDVASGVERIPGSKDPERLRLFIERARDAREAISS